MHAWEAIEGHWILLRNTYRRISEYGGAGTVGRPFSFYFQRLFKRLTGRPVLEYVKMRRLACRLGA